jgi:hypothetical protein
MVLMGVRNQHGAERTRVYLGRRESGICRKIERHSRIDQNPLATRFNLDTGSADFVRATMYSDFHGTDCATPLAQGVSLVNEPLFHAQLQERS